MLHQRGAGVLMHISALPSPYGIVVFDRHARDFIDRIADMGFTYWQVLPFNPIDGAGSPYCSPSAFAGNYLFIDPQGVQDMGLVTAEEVVANRYDGTPYTADFAFAGERRLALLEQAFLRIDDTLAAKIKAFEVENPWLTDYSVFMAVKEAEGGKPWWQWSDRHAHYHTCIQDIYAYESRAAFWKFVQYIFYLQWDNIKAYANEKGISVIGDAPIFVSYDSADVWAHQKLFRLASKGFPTCVTGVPPDYFSETGQLWGNPHYAWREHEKTGFAWWLSRIQKNLQDVDILRIDHFRGFSACWEVAFGAEDARGGKWASAPGEAFFTLLKEKLGSPLPLIAEDLGIITDEVAALRDFAGLPGMRILQFAFGQEKNNPYLPHCYDKNTIVYTGTHDNDTTNGWYQAATEQEKDHYRRYLNVDGSNAAWDFIRLALSSPADTAILPLQAVLSLGTELRMNIPGTTKGYWSFTFSFDWWQEGFSEGLRYLSALFGRNEQAEKAAEETDEFLR